MTENLYCPNHKTSSCEFCTNYDLIKWGDKEAVGDEATPYDPEKHNG